MTSSARPRRGGDLVFRIAIDSSNGAVTLTQYRAMVHGNPERFG